MRISKTRPDIVLAAVATLLLAGCDQLTRDHYDLITQDVSTTDDVSRALGEPTNKLPWRWHYERLEPNLNVFIDFNADGVVTRKQWIDASTGEWDDTAVTVDSNSSESTTIRTRRD